MLKRCLPFFAIGLALVVAAPIRGASLKRTPEPARHIAGLDGPLVGVTDATGRSWVAWSYRNGTEYDIAVSVLDDGHWSEPTLLETDDGLDEVEPALAADEHGNLYLAYSVRQRETVQLTVLPAGTSTWTAPLPLSALGEAATIPNLRIVDGKLIVAYRSRARVRIKTLPLSELVGDDSCTITDGPDPIGKHHDK